jgi:hypothetical protein
MKESILDQLQRLVLEMDGGSSVASLKLCFIGILQEAAKELSQLSTSRPI